ncbi:Phosphopantothenoylcysteine decarboxylase [Erysiphe neolycopersici]|uniref:Phosphopantothenoylcysteine decarboxylase n=1 Tax=Erysiphe neolycopersici TaxID=212602 RepID=A0A420I254_9PEZI|nr:Phosphopantothenoylcysteine decarboxylase [Erysiphe neolycopersici]
MSPNQKKKNPSFVAADFESDGKKHLLLCASGSVATIKIPHILESLSKHSKLSIRLIFTKAALHFLNHPNDREFQFEKFNSLPNVDGIFLDDDEWTEPWNREGKILHIELRRWADIMLIAPLSANTQAKIVAGMADNLLTSVVRAWDTEGRIQSTGERKRIIVAPAMNTAMWNHPITKIQLKTLSHDWAISEGCDSEKAKEHCQGWFEVLRPVEKKLACGDIGIGAMCEWNDIVKVIEKRLRL